MTVTGKPVTLLNVTKHFGQARAVDAVTLTAEAGKITTLLGPSGCGKTTTLRLIGGFHQADEGEIRIGDTRVNDLPPHARSSRTVFQSYALFPHMTVFENVAFGLRATNVPRGEIPQRVDRTLAKVGLQDMGQRAPGRLSGGQKQRVSIARALIKKPDIVILDDCLSAVDTNTEKQILSYFEKVLSDKTAIVITHRIYSLLQFDKIIVLEDGKIAEAGTHEELLANKGYYAEQYEKQSMEETPVE